MSDWLHSLWIVDTVKNCRTKTVELFLYGRRSAAAECGLRFFPINPLWLLWREEGSYLMGLDNSLKKHHDSLWRLKTLQRQIWRWSRDHSEAELIKKLHSGINHFFLIRQRPRLKRCKGETGYQRVFTFDQFGSVKTNWWLHVYSSKKWTGAGPELKDIHVLHTVAVTVWTPLKSFYCSNVFKYKHEVLPFYALHLSDGCVTNAFSD